MHLQGCDHVTSRQTKQPDRPNPPTTPSPLHHLQHPPPREERRECENSGKKMMIKVNPIDRTARPTRAITRQASEGEILFISCQDMMY